MEPGEVEEHLLASAETGSRAHIDDKNRLELILSNADNLPWRKMMRAAVFLESKLLWSLALPAIVVYMVNYIMSMATQIFCGHLGNLELAAASLGNTGIQVFAYGLMH
uniref:Protein DETOXIFICATION n=1 Tax=Picea sitchensis TaxID=3332 RepID=B8LRL0_PICSI|nr:unknown [Picea sitchensis]